MWVAWEDQWESNSWCRKYFATIFGLLWYHRAHANNKRMHSYRTRSRELKCVKTNISFFHAMYVMKQKTSRTTLSTFVLHFYSQTSLYGMKFGWQKKDLVRLEVIGCSYFFLTQFVAALVMLPKVFQYINIWTLFPMKQLNTPKISSKFWPISLHDIFFCFGNLATVIFLFQN